MNRKEQTEKFALSAIGYTFAVLGVLILLSQKLGLPDTASLLFPANFN